MNTPLLHFITNGHHFTVIKEQQKIVSVTYHKNVATLGVFCKLSKQDLKKYVKQFPTHWVTA